MISTIVRRGWSRYAAFVGGAASLAYVMTNRWWAGEWQAAVQAVTNSLVLLAPGVIFAAAADTRSLMPRNGSSWLNATEDARGRVTSLLFALWIPSAMAVTVLLLNAGAFNAGLSTFHFPGVSLLQPYVWVLLFIALGVLGGRLLPLIAVAPLSLMFGFVLPVVLAGTPDTRASMLTPIDDGAVAPPIFLRSEVVAIQIGVCALATFAVMTFAFSRNSSKFVGVRALSALAVIMLVLVGFRVGPERRYEATDAEGPRECATRDGIEICVWPDHRSLLEPALEASTSLRSELPTGFQEPPIGFVERGLDAPPGWASFTTGTAESTVAEMASVMVYEVFSGAVCGNGEHLMPSVAVSERRLWLLQRMGLLTSQATPPDLAEVLALPEPQQEDWFNEATRDGAMSCAVD